MKTSSPSQYLPFLGLSFATSPFIFSMLTIYLLGELMAEFGKVSEEIFRSERLPLLNLLSLEP